MPRLSLEVKPLKHMIMIRFVKPKKEKFAHTGYVKICIDPNIDFAGCCYGRIYKTRLGCGRACKTGYIVAKIGWND